MSKITDRDKHKAKNTQLFDLYMGMDPEEYLEDLKKYIVPYKPSGTDLFEFLNK